MAEDPGLGGWASPGKDPHRRLPPPRDLPKLPGFFAIPHPTAILSVFSQPPSLPG